MELITDTLKIKKAPKTAGFTFRHFRGEEDFPAMLDVYKDAMEADGLEAADTLEDLENNYNHLVRSDPATDMLMAEVDGDLVAYGRCWWDKELDDTYRYSFFINMKPEWRYRGIGNVYAKFLMNRLTDIAGQHPAEAEKYFQAYSTEKQKWQTALLEYLGFEIIRYSFKMVRPCSEPVKIHPLPKGIIVRTPTPQEYRKVWEADHEAFRDHFGYVEPSEDWYHSWLKESSFDPTLWKVAWDGEEIAGQVLNFIDANQNEEYGRKRGYTEDISTRRPWRRQGIARALLTQSIQMFQEMGMEETALNVDAENANGALKLYTSVGYKETRRNYVLRKPITTKKPETQAHKRN